AACTPSQGRYTAMRTALDSINVLNRTDQPFTVADVQPYVDYFDRYGNSNDRLLAHYLLGRAYHEQGEAPMALQCYQQAADCADTTAADCDYKQLCRVYSQMDVILYQQGLYQEELLEIEKAIKYAKLGKDTLAALDLYDQKGKIFQALEMKDSLFHVCEQAAALYKKHHYPAYAAIVIGRTIKPLIDVGRYDKAYQNLQVYESESGLFDNYHNIVSGREIFYACKGLLFLSYNQTDSAEYYFRKELRNGKDFNNQNTGALGLAQVYQKKNVPDSAAKYYRYAYAMNDSMYAQKTTETVERLQSMYDYSRHQELARKESERATQERQKRQTVAIILVLVALLSAITIYELYKRKQAERARYLQSIADLEQSQSDIMQLRQHASDYASLIAQKEKQMEQLKKKMQKYSKLIYFDKADVERHLKASTTYQELEKKAVRGETPTEEDWRNIRMLVIEYLPGFNDFLTSHAHRLTENKYNICILLRLHFKSVDISKILGIKPPSVSDACSTIMRNVFQKEGSAKELTATLSEIF
ncbi:MAG: hypothetical protein IJQ86_00745, partial [Spirochaetia bacterium]|nr:hypothetical protein [Spirochaetia bacterium]